MVLTRTSWILIAVAVIMIVAGAVGVGLGVWKHGYGSLHPTTKATVSVLWRAMFWGGLVALIIGVIMLAVVLVWGHHKRQPVMMSAQRPTSMMYDTVPVKRTVVRTV